MRFARIVLRALLATVAALALAALPATAQDRCLAFARAPAPSLVQPAAVRLAQLKSADVRISFIGHSTFLLESASGVKVATDYNDYVRPGRHP